MAQPCPGPEFAPRQLDPFLRKSSDRHGIVPDIVVLHWTAGPGEPDDLARYFRTAPVEASYHVAIGRDGDTLQMVALNRAAWHAGDGRIEGTRPNPRSVGVALCNRGPVDNLARVPAVSAEHWKVGIRSKLWEQYPDAQVQALARVLAWLKRELPSLALICGHEDITHGKPDPGPALPWDVLGLDDLGLSRWLGPWPARWPRF